MQIVLFSCSRHGKRCRNARFAFCGAVWGKEGAETDRSPLCFRLVLFPPLPGREAVAFVKRPGKVQLIGVAALGRDGADGRFCSLQLVGGLGEAEAD